MIGGLVARHTITVQRPTRVPDGHNGFDDSWDPPASSTALSGWAIDAGPTTEDLDNREGTRVEYTLRGPITHDVRANDRVLWDGVSYRVDGAPVKQPGPSPATSHQIVKLSAWKG